MHLLSAIRSFAQSKKAAFYVPGHKGNKAKASTLHKHLQELSLSSDLTELDGLDNLHSADGVIDSAQRRASTIFSSASTFFLVNGSTCGILAAICATCSAGSTLMVSRACHGSVFNAAAIAGCHLATIEPEVDTLAGVPLGITTTALAAALDDTAASGCDWPPIKAVLITSPTYHGACSDVRAIAEVCHARGVLLLVDEAHGAHLGLHPSLPPCAMHAGADVAVQSTHKTLGSLTQSAMLHVGPAAPPGLAPAIARHLSVFQSTSPSYLLMASLEIAAHDAADPAAFEEPLRAAAHVRDAWHECGRLTLCSRAADDAESGSERDDSEEAHVRSGIAGGAAAESVSCAAYDPLRATLLATGTGLTGFQLSSALQQHGVVAEMATENTVVLALGVGSTLRDAALAAHAFRKVAGEVAARCGLLGGSSSTAAAACERSCGDVRPGLPLVRPQLDAWLRGLAPSGPSHDSRDLGPGTTSGAAFIGDIGMQWPGVSSAMERRYQAAGHVSMVGPLGRALAAAPQDVLAEAAVGRRSGGLVAVYPPGVPLLLYGEVITADAVAALAAAAAAGARLTGCGEDGHRLMVLE
eukprot:jgi/Ulvmu1/11989/UM082_0068.1